MRIPHQQLLGGMSPEQFLSEYWQKKPLLVRQAVPDFAGLLSLEQLRRLAQREDAISRLVEADGSRWRLEQGPFASRRWNKLAPQWTLLVQNLNHFLPAAAELFYSFDFISHARLDDLQVSASPAGSGIGPHLDSYDVFLLQAQGSKRWQISTQSDHELEPDVPLKILSNFRPEQEWILQPGDMLYLPPGVAHCGTAVEAGMTYSIGFRAPETSELACSFLEFLQDNLQFEGRYADADLKVAAHPAAIDPGMCKRVAGMLQAIRWDEQLVADFLGMMLSEPKAHVFFDGPERPLTRNRFARAVAEQGIRLDLKSQLLFSDGRFYFNGDAFDADGEEAQALRELADRRQLAAGSYSEVLLDWMYDAYCHGTLEVGYGTGV